MGAVLAGVGGSYMVDRYTRAKAAQAAIVSQQEEANRQEEEANLKAEAARLEAAAAGRAAPETSKTPERMACEDRVSTTYGSAIRKGRSLADDDRAQAAYKTSLARCAAEEAAAVARAAEQKR